jgi:prepilin-type processing-associated H-X9-DG protein/prepilin-type N-terminal cleavage/methylation domain-containing protein
MYRKKSSGFTLIEILVTLGIIVILAAILFPVFAKARASARRTSCASNLKQLATAIMMYMQDHDQTYPMIVQNKTANVSPSNPFGWADSLDPYVKNTQVFQCPDEAKAPNPSGHGLPVDPTTSSATGGYTDYWINAQLNGVSGSTYYSLAKGDIISPTQTVLLAEGGGNSARYTANGCAASNVGDSHIADDGHPYNDTVLNTPFSCTSTAVGVLVNTSTNLTGAAYRHLGGSNYAFADGHVKWLAGNAKVYNRYTPSAQANGGVTYSTE